MFPCGVSAPSASARSAQALRWSTVTKYRPNSGLELPAPRVPHHSDRTQRCSKVRLLPYGEFLRLPKGFRINKHTSPSQTTNPDFRLNTGLFKQRKYQRGFTGHVRNTKSSANNCSCSLHPCTWRQFIQQLSEGWALPTPCALQGLAAALSLLWTRARPRMVGSPETDASFFK